MDDNVVRIRYSAKVMVDVHGTMLVPAKLWEATEKDKTGLADAWDDLDGYIAERLDISDQRNSVDYCSWDVTVNDTELDTDE